MAACPIPVYPRPMNRSFSPLSSTLLDPLPPIVQRYLRMALPHGIPESSEITLTQRGAMRLKEGSLHWLPFSASERLGVNPPGFVWRARFRFGPLITATVVDQYLDGIGSINARLWGVIPLVHPQPDQHLNEGALLRYLAEATWFPVALLPSVHLQWQAAGNLSAVAILRDASTEARLTVHFNTSGELMHVEAQRPYLSGKEYLTRGWSGRFSEWSELGGLRIPTRGRVFWHLGSGEWEYWRGTVESLTFSHNQ